MYQLAPAGALSSVTSLYLWIFSIILLCGVIAGLIYFIAIPTLITMLIPAHRRDKANGLFSTATGVSFGINSIASGLVLGFGGMFWVLIAGIAFTLLSIAYLAFIPLSEERPIRTETEKQEKTGIRATIKLMKSIPGLFALIFFSTFNNLLAGVFFALMDAYGLELISVQIWGTLWGALSPFFYLRRPCCFQKGIREKPAAHTFHSCHNHMA